MDMLKESIAIAMSLALSAGVVVQDAEEAADELPVEAETGFFSEWSGNVSFGLYGSDGNTERLNLRGEVDGARETDKNLTTFLTTYSYAEDDGDESENRFNSEIENQFKLEDPTWFLFGRGQFEHDEFQDWDQRLSFYAGPGHVFLDNDKTKVSGKVGVGALREFGGEDDDWTAEGIISAEASHQITERQSITASVDFFPNLEDTEEFRVNSRAVWELLVDPEVNMTLRAGVEDRYQSDPGGDADKNDIDFFIMLSWAY